MLWPRVTRRVRPEILVRPALVAASLWLSVSVGRWVVESQQMVVLVFAGLGALALLVNPARSLSALVIGLFSVQYLADWGFLPRVATYFPEMILLALLAYWAMTQLRERRSLQGSVLPVDLAILLLVAITLLSALVNGLSPFTYLVGVRKFLKYILFFYLLLNSGFDERLLRSTLSLFFTLSFLQAPIVLAQWTQLGAGDFTGGTTARQGTGILSVLATMAAAMAWGYYLEMGQKRYAIGALALFAVLPFALSYAGFWFLPVMSASLLLYRAIASQGKRGIQTLLIPAITFPVLFYGLVLIGSRFAPFLQLDVILSPSRTSELLDPTASTSRSAEPGRLTALWTTLEILPHLPYAGWFGAGPGAASESSIEGFTGDLWQSVATLTWGDLLFRHQLTITLTEVGYAGLLCYLGLFAALLAMNYRFYRFIRDPYWKALSIAFAGFVFTMLMSAIYHPVWFINVLSFLFWLVAGMIVLKGRQEGIFGGGNKTRHLGVQT